MAAEAPSPPIRVAAWDQMSDAMRDLPSQLLAKLPETMRNDPQIQQEVARLALAAFTLASLDALASDRDHPSFVIQGGQALNVGQPNADTIYRVARIAPGGSYRLRGKRGTARIVKLGESGPSPYETGWKRETGTRPYHDLNSLRLDAQGSFDVLMSATRPAGYTGDWWPLQPTTDKLILRSVASDWARETDPAIAIERTDTSVMRRAPDAQELARRLALIPKFATFLTSLFVDHVEKLRAAGFVNQVKSYDVSKMGGLAGQSYYEGAYDLADDEALILEAKVPAQCAYRSMLLTNRIYETANWTDNQSSLNDAQAAPDADGVLRIVVSAKDPGVANWLDTAGERQGLVQGRWTDCSEAPVPSVRKVKLSALRKALPVDTLMVTPAQRERTIRDRRAAYQLRPLW